ncbi:MAG: hydroxymethylbilane synthase [Verrucomicrobiales bacterium]|nr:hydroxymethylbilane synthase [Verrucomicrobiales bacterium]
MKPQGSKSAKSAKVGNKAAPSGAVVRIATRGSALAMAQANTVLALCASAFPRRRFELVVIKTTGDRRQAASMNRPAPDLPKGLFTKELEVALLRGRADLAVHSLKDLPTELPEGLCLGATLPRADVRDVLVTRRTGRRLAAAKGLMDLPRGATVATSSTRRVAQLKAARPDLRFVEIRGNVPTRLRKLAESREIDATILAWAGLSRLGVRRGAGGILTAPEGLDGEGWSGKVGAVLLSARTMLPAPGQAAIGLECRRGDARVRAVCRAVDHAETRWCVEAERAFLAGFGGGCHSPIAAWARVTAGGTLSLEAVVFEGEMAWRGSGEGPAARSAAAGRVMGRVAREALGLSARTGSPR